MNASPLRILFRVAAGPQVGFGHLMRSRSLARALDVAPLVSIRGNARTRATAAALGWTVLDGTNDAAVATVRPDLMVIDDPGQPDAQQWVRRARRLGVPVVSVHDLGRSIVDSDLVIDGSILPAASVSAPALLGPAYAILDPAIAKLRAEPPPPMLGRVLIALGGGTHVYAIAGELSQALFARMPALDIRVACGFAPPATLPPLARGSWIASTNGLAGELAAAAVAVVAGGVTMYEACALKKPIVAMPVVAEQDAATRAFAIRGGVLSAGWPHDDRTVARVAEAIVALFQDSSLRKRMIKQAARLVDGEGVFRVADRIRVLAAGRGAAHAA